MGRIFAFLAVVSCCIVVSHGGEKLDCECGVAKYGGGTMAERIVGGRRAKPHSLPWLVAILLHDAMHCGASIITDRHVLSAGHCAQWSNPNDMVVLYGLDTMEDVHRATTRLVERVVIHEGFASTKMRDENDIAIFYVDRPVRFNKKIIPVCLPDSERNFGGLMGTIAGWGRLGKNDKASNVLMRTKQRIMKQEECTNTALKEHLTPHMMCAYFKGRDGCQGDSGGPIMVIASGKYQQAGVVSWGIGCADPRYPGIYTNVSQYVDWIREKIEDGATCAH